MRKDYLIYICFCTCIALFFASAINNASGPGGGYANDPGESNCTSCHGGSIVTTSNANLNNLLLNNNFVSGGYVPDTVHKMEVAFKQSGRVKYGFQITALTSIGNLPIGTLNIISGNNKSAKVTKVNSGNTREYIQHTSSGNTNGGADSIKWQFTWKAPSTFRGNVKFHVVVMATDNNGGQNSGDIVYGKVFEFGPSPLLPKADASSLDSNTCQGYVAAMKGTGTNSTTSYSWKFTGATPTTSTQQNPNVTFNTAGTQLAILTVKNSLGSSVPDTLRVNVKSSPAASVLNGTSATICNGDSLSVSANALANVTYLWTNGKTTRTIFLKDTGNYKVTVTSTTNGCARTSANFRLNVNPLPTIAISRKGNSADYCNTISDSLIATGTDIDSILWYNNGVIFRRTKSKTIFFSSNSNSSIYAIAKSTSGCRSANSNTLISTVVKPLNPRNIVATKTTSTISLKFKKPNAITYLEYSTNAVNFNQSTTDSTIEISGLNPSSNYTITLRSTQLAPCGSSDTSFTVRTENCANIQYSISAPSRVCKGNVLTATLKDLYKANKYSISFNGQPYQTDTIFSFNPSKSDTLNIYIKDSLSPTCPAILEKIGYTVDTLPIDNSVSVNISSCNNQINYSLLPLYQTYEFYLNNVLKYSGTNNTFNFTGLVSGDVYKGVGIINSCKKELSGTFTLNPASDATFTYSRNWKTYTFVADDNNNTQYNWRINGNIAGPSKDSLIIDMSTYTNSNVTVSLATTNFTTCTDSTSQSVTVPNFASVNSNEIGNIKVYPNPFNNTLNIETILDIEYEMYDMTGKLVLSNSSNTIDTENLSNGLYLLKIYHNNQLVSQQKIVKE